MARTKNRRQLQMFWVAVQRLCSFLYCICIQAPTWFLARIFQTLLQTQCSKIQCNSKVWYKLFGAYSMEIYSFWIFLWVCCKLQTFESQLQIHGVHGDNFSQCRSCKIRAGKRTDLGDLVFLYSQMSYKRFLNLKK